MSLPLYSAWFPGGNAVLLGRRDAGSDLTGTTARTAKSGGPRPTHGYWMLPGRSVARIPIDDRYEIAFFLNGDTWTVRLGPDGKAAENGELFLAACRGRDGEQDSPQLFFVEGGSPWSDISEVHGRVREVLGLRPSETIDKIWRSPFLLDNKNIVLQPAQLLWPYGGPRQVEIRLLKSQIPRIALTARHDARRQPQEAPVPSEFVPVDGHSAFVLVWRSLFHGRANATPLSGFMQLFQANLKKYLKREVPLGRAQSASPIAKRPVKRGYFFPRADSDAAPLKPGEIITYEFSGPLDMYDVVAVCLVSRPNRPIAVAVDPDRPSPHVLDVDGCRIELFCWRAGLDRLAAIAWSDAGDDAKSAIEAQLLDELCGPQKTIDQGVAPASGLATGSDSEGAPGGETTLVATVPLARQIEPGDAFAVERDAADAVVRWLATLDVETVGRLCALPASNRPHITNISRFLPISIASMLDDPAAWKTVEHDAAFLCARITAIRHIMEPEDSAAELDPRSDAPLWQCLTEALSVVNPAVAAEAKQIISAFAPDAAGSLAVLKPSMLRSAGLLLQDLETRLRQLPRESEAAEIAHRNPELDKLKLGNSVP
jgi:hypothetical protein